MTLLARFAQLFGPFKHSRVEGYPLPDDQRDAGRCEPVETALRRRVKGSREQ